MKGAVVAAVLLFASAFSLTQVSAGHANTECTAKVLHSEALPYAPIGSWLARVTLEVVPPNGAAFITTFYHDVAWQRSAPRRGEVFRVNCDAVNGLNYH